MHNLVAGLHQLRLGDEVFHHLAVLYLGQAQYRMPHAVVLPHVRNHTGHVVQLGGVFVRRPLVGTVRQELVVVLTLVMGGIEQVLHIVEPDDVLGTLLLGTTLRGQQQHDGQYGQDGFFHTQLVCNYAKIVIILGPPSFLGTYLADFVFAPLFEAMSEHLS